MSRAALSSSLGFINEPESSTAAAARCLRGKPRPTSSALAEEAKPGRQRQREAEAGALTADVAAVVPEAVAFHVALDLTALLLVVARRHRPAGFEGRLLILILQTEGRTRVVDTLGR